MNELIFFAHTLIVILFALFALRMGPSCLIAWIVLQGIFANLFVVKQIDLFGFAVTCSDVFAIGGILSLNLLQEYFGKDKAKSALKISLFSLLFFIAMAEIHLQYIPNASDVTHSAFFTIFSSSPRIVLASIATFFIVQQFDVRFFSFLKGALPSRIAISLFCSQLLDTILFSYLGLYQLVESVFDIIIVSFLIKCIVILISAPFTTFSKRFVRHELSV